jgi:hypothetical protein
VFERDQRMEPGRTGSGDEACCQRYVKKIAPPPLKLTTSPGALPNRSAQTVR